MSSILAGSAKHAKWRAFFIGTPGRTNSPSEAKPRKRVRIPSESNGELAHRWRAQVYSPSAKFLAGSAKHAKWRAFFIGTPGRTNSPSEAKPRKWVRIPSESNGELAHRWRAQVYSQTAKFLVVGVSSRINLLCDTVAESGSQDCSVASVSEALSDGANSCCEYKYTLICLLHYAILIMNSSL